MGEIIIGGGCFWCTEAMFLSLIGVISVTNGYSGGNIPNPSYKEVCTGETNHAECVKIVFDSTQISFSELIDIHLNSHDPTTLNRQGGDVGTQYRSVVFYKNEQEKEIIQSRIAENQKHYPSAIVTTVEKFNKFYSAEDYHQNYFERNKDKNPYCQLVDEKLQKMLKKYASKVKK